MLTSFGVGVLVNVAAYYLTRHPLCPPELPEGPLCPLRHEPVRFPRAQGGHVTFQDRHAVAQPPGAPFPVGTSTQGRWTL